MSGSVTASRRIARWYVPRGRLTLTRFWTHYCVPFMAAAWVAYLVDSEVGWPQTPGTLDVVTWLGGPFSALVAALTLVPTVAAVVCRLHDRGHSADWLWWLALPGLGWVILVADVWFSSGHAADNAYGPWPDRPPPALETSRVWIA